MIGTIAAALGAATSIANGIFGAASASKQKKAQLDAVAQQEARSNALYNKIMNEDATQRADAQRLLTKANDAIKKRSLAAAGKRAVMGGTDASQAVVQQANAETMGNAVSDIAAKSDARKDAAEQRHAQEMNNLTTQRSNIISNAEAAKRQAMAQAATGVVNSAASVLGASDVGGTSGSTGAVKKAKSLIDLAKAARGE